MPLKKQHNQKVNIESTKEDLKTVKEIEKIEGKAWIDIVYAKNGIRRKERR